MRLLYSALFYAIAPAIVARLYWRSKAAPAYRHRIAERFGLYADSNATPPDGVIWIHAVSVGEAEAAFPLIRYLLDRLPGQRLLVTTTTPTGSARVQSTLGEQVEHVYLPYDLPDAVARFLDRFRPVAAVFMETEIWPNLLSACTRRAIPTAIVNARLSDRSAHRYGKISSFVRSVLESVTWIATQTDADRDRFLALGARPEAVEVTGNLKYDLQLPDDLSERADQLRRELFGVRPILLAASTHPGEDTALLEAFATLRKTIANLLLILVPRHPERFDAVVREAVAAGWRTNRRSAATTDGEADVFVVDTLGELRQFCALADVVFVGGSLVPIGGHNALEPAAVGVPVLFGPHMQNFREIAKALLEDGAAVQVKSSDELASVAGRWLADPDEMRAVGERGRKSVAAGRGAVTRIGKGLIARIRQPIVC